jgi:enoyl-CoA hydratase/carnithine racemase
MAHSVRIEREGAVTVLTLDRPAMNALDTDFTDDIRETLEGVAADESVRALVVTGAGKAFSAGVDLAIVPDLEPADQDVLLEALNRMFATFYGMPLPVVTAANGHAIAGGIVLALCGDHRVAAPSGKHGLTEVAVGVQFPAVTREIVQAELDPGAVRRLIFSAELMGADAAKDLGVYDELADDPLAAALDVAAALAKHNRSVYGTIMASVRGAALARMQDAIANDPLKGNWLSEELREIARARLAKA